MALKQKRILFMVALLALQGVLLASTAQAAQIGDRYLRLSNAFAGAVNVTYSLGIDRPDSGVLGSIELEICTNDPFPGTPCTVPASLNFIGSSVANQSGITGFSVQPATTSNKLILGRTPNVEPSGMIQIDIFGVQNPTPDGTYYGRIRTFASNDGSGVSIDTGGLAIAINPQYTISTEVPPYLLFCSGITITGLQCSTATGSYVDVGELSPNRVNSATSQLLIGTNAGPGFIISITGTPPTAGNNVIPGLSTKSASAPGTSQFGINLVYNSSPQLGQDPAGPGLAQPTADYGTSNRFKYTSGDIIVSRNGTSDFRKFTVSYIINVSSSQNPGIYNTSLLYTALATF